MIVNYFRSAKSLTGRLRIWYTDTVCLFAGERVADAVRRWQGTTQFDPDPHTSGRPGFGYQEKMMAVDVEQKKGKKPAKEQKEPGWRGLPMAGLILEAGGSEKYESGDWRIERPVWDAEKCTSCLLCWVYCPDSAILVDEEGKMVGVDLDHCKGCGICAEECPPKVKAFTMVPESEFRGK